MPYTLTHRANHTVEIAAHLESAAVERERDGIVRNFRSKAQIPGFRPGKAPVAAVRARFADEIRDELQEHLANLLWSEVFEGESGIEPITNPQVKDLSFADDGGFSFTAELEVRPRYELPELADLSLPEVSLDVSEAEIDEELAKVQEEQAVWEPAEDDQAEDGMLAEVDLRGEVEDSDDEPYVEDGANLIIGADSVPLEINQALQGAKIGDQRTATKTLPDDLEDKDKAGKTVTYTISVKGLKRKVLPEIDDDLAVTIGLENLEELRQRVHDVLQQQKRGERRNTWRRFVLDHLEADIDQAELPSSLVQSTLKEQLDRYAYTMAMQGVEFDPDKVDWHEISAKAEPAARQEVLDTLILEQLAETWETPVPEAEVDAYIATEAARHGLPPAEHKANLAAERKLERVRHAARVAATVDEMIRRAGGEVE
jgi:trigger factor